MKVGGGVATFSNLVLNTAGFYALSGKVNGLPSATSTGFWVNPASASKLIFHFQPSNTTAGSAINPAVQVQVEDQFGNLVGSRHHGSGHDNDRQWPGSLASSSIAKVTVGGMATFSNLVLNTAGPYTLAPRPWPHRCHLQHFQRRCRLCKQPVFQ